MSLIKYKNSLLFVSPSIKKQRVKCFYLWFGGLFFIHKAKNSIDSNLLDANQIKKLYEGITDDYNRKYRFD